MLTCEECGCLSDDGKGWYGYIVEDPEDGEGPVVALYCPPCAVDELGAKARASYL